MLNRINLSRIDLNLLVLFEAVIEEGHVGRTAARLNLTPSAVSHGLGRLRRLMNDPLFLRTPKGVVPTARARELAGPIGEVLAGVRRVLEAAGPFDPAASRRRFAIGAPDGVSAVLLPPLLAALGRAAPGIDVSLRQLLPRPGEASPDRAWTGAFDALEARALDVAVVPTEAIPARFAARLLYEEDFVVAMRAGHRLAEGMGLGDYASALHAVVSHAGDALGFVDEVLAAAGLARRIALTVPNFLFALAIAGETELVAAVPRRFAARYAAGFGAVAVDGPVPLGRFRLQAVVPAAALADAGTAWLVERLAAAAA